MSCCHPSPHASDGFQRLVAAGILCSASVDYLLAANGSWRWMFGLSVVPGALMVLGMWRMPESPRYLAEQGRDDEARQVLLRLRGGGGAVDAELQEIKLVIAAGQAAGGSVCAELKKPDLQRALLAGCGIMLFSQAQGINTVIYFAPKIFTFTGLFAKPLSADRQANTMIPQPPQHLATQL